MKKILTQHNSNSLRILFALLLCILCHTSIAHAQTVISATNGITVSAIVSNGVVVPPGGGGGSPSSSSVDTTIGTGVLFSGLSYPYAKIHLLQNGVLAYTATARGDATFSIPFPVSAAGMQLFSLSAEDTEARRSILVPVPIVIADSTVTTVNNIFFPPTLSLQNTTVGKGTALMLSGQSVPSATVSLYNDGTVVSSILADALGKFSTSLDTTDTILGSHTVQVKSKTLSGKESGLGALQSYIVSLFNPVVPIDTTKSADISGDGVINITDFSILAYWYGKSTPPTNVDLNGDGVVTLTDFSILAYQWND